jgi:hypothetical protein
MYVVKTEDVKNEIENRFISYKDFISDLELDEFKSIKEIITMVKSIIVRPFIRSVEEHTERLNVEDIEEKTEFNYHLFKPKNN